MNNQLYLNTRKWSLKQLLDAIEYTQEHNFIDAEEKLYLQKQYKEVYDYRVAQGEDTPLDILEVFEDEIMKLLK